MSPMTDFCYATKIKIEKRGESGIQGKMHPPCQFGAYLISRMVRAWRDKEAKETNPFQPRSSQQVRPHDRAEKYQPRDRCGEPFCF